VTEVTVATSGFAELDEALGELKLSTAKGVLRRVATRALQPFDDRWREMAPRRTGQLAESGAVGTKLSARQRQQAELERDSFVEVFAGPGTNPQAIQDEFGNRHQAATPFVRPAWDEKQGEALEIVQRDLGEEIEKTAARAAARKAKAATRI
jgi:HK97 gp10 family phage protein